jgi:spore maturation protein CgeB
VKIAVLGLSITSSWGNGHATTYRALMRALAARQHEVLFLERDVPWYARHRDLAHPRWCKVRLYRTLPELMDGYRDQVAGADLVIVGSYVPDGAEVGAWVTATARGLTAFYDIDTPVTLAALERGRCTYLTSALVPRFDLYLSFTGGPPLERLERRYRARAARPLYGSFDPDQYFPEVRERRWDLGHLGTYAACHQPVVERLLVEPARRWRKARMVVAGPQYPPGLRWPKNVARIDPLAPPDHRAFYAAQRFTLNATRADLVGAGYSPSVRLFEAAACGTPILSDRWRGLEAFFRPGEEILVAGGPADVLRALRKMPDAAARAMAERARARVLAEHTSAHRALELERYVSELERRRRRASRSA